MENSPGSLTIKLSSPDHPTTLLVEGSSTISNVFVSCKGAEHRLSLLLAGRKRGWRGWLTKGGGALSSAAFDIVSPLWLLLPWCDFCSGWCIGYSEKRVGRFKYHQGERELWLKWRCGATS